MFRALRRFSVTNKMITLYRQRNYDGLKRFWPAFLAYKPEDIKAVVTKTSTVLAQHAPGEHQIFLGDLVIRGVVDQEGNWLI